MWSLPEFNDQSDVLLGPRIHLRPFYLFCSFSQFLILTAIGEGKAFASISALDLLALAPFAPFNTLLSSSSRIQPERGHLPQHVVQLAGLLSSGPISLVPTSGHFSGLISQLQNLNQCPQIPVARSRAQEPQEPQEPIPEASKVHSPRFCHGPPVSTTSDFEAPHRLYNPGRTGVCPVARDWEGAVPTVWIGSPWLLTSSTLGSGKHQHHLS